MSESRIEAVTVAPDSAHEHAYAREHLAWHVAGTLDEAAARRIDAHLAVCEACRHELAEEAVIADAMGTEQAVELAPQASFARLMTRIDAREARRDRIARWLRPLTGERAQRPLIFTAAVQAVVIVMLTGVLLAVLLRPTPPAEYRTLSNPPPAPATAAHGTQLRLVVDEQLTLAQLRDLLAPLDARIVSGPEANGILTIDVAGASAADALRTLRAQRGVRLAEIVTE